MISEWMTVEKALEYTEDQWQVEFYARPLFDINSDNKSNVDQALQWLELEHKWRPFLIK